MKKAKSDRRLSMRHPKETRSVVPLEDVHHIAMKTKNDEVRRAVPLSIVIVGLINALVIFTGTSLFQEKPPIDLLYFYEALPFAFFLLLFHRPFRNFTNPWGKQLARFHYFLKIAVIVPGTVLAYAAIYRCLGLIDGNNWSTDPTTSLYFSLVTWTTVGYGDVKPVASARMFAASEAVLGHIVMTILLFAIAIKYQYVLKPFQIESATTSNIDKQTKPSGKKRQSLPWSRKFMTWLEGPIPEVFVFRMTSINLFVVVLYDYLIVFWLLNGIQAYPEPLWSIAVYGTPFILLGTMVHTKLFFWRSELIHYYERTYFTLKAAFAVPGIILSYAASYRVLGLQGLDGKGVDPISALYFSIVTWTTLGYGDIYPSPAARLLAASEAVVGYLTMAILLGLSASWFLSFLFSDKSSI